MSNSKKTKSLTDRSDAGISRRRFLSRSAAGAAGVAVFHKTLADVPQTDPTKQQGTPPAALGERSPFEKPERKVISNILSTTPLQDLHGTITPSDLHFERHHGGIPLIDPDSYKLIIHGMVERPLKFSLDDLKSFPATTRSCFIECSGNNGEYYWDGKENTPQTLRGLTSQSEWTGIRLSTLFREAGISSRARWMLAEGNDAAVMTRSIPVAKAWDDALIVYAQNGEAIRPAQGYPVRLLLPGWEGSTNIKWLRRLELGERPFMTREETSKYSEPLPDGRIRQFSFELEANSVITSPAYPEKLEPGWLEIRGLAWSGSGKIVKVEVSTDAGQNWSVAELQGPVLAKSHTRFRYLWNWQGKPAVIMSRAIDQTGYIQPTHEALRDERGLGAPYHLNTIVGWAIRPDGSVYFDVKSWG